MQLVNRMHASGAGSGRKTLRNCSCPGVAPTTAFGKQGAHPRKSDASKPRLMMHSKAVAVASEVAAPTGAARDFGSSKAQGLRDGMEDETQLYFDDTLQYLYGAIFDGHGGPQAAEWLSQHLHTYLSKHFQESGKEQLSSEDISSILTSAFAAAEKQLMEHLSGMGKEVLTNAGSTGTIAIVNDSQVLVANLGDSQAFLLRKNQAMELTTPHRVYGPGDIVRQEIARVKSTGAWVHDGRVCNILAVSRAFGDWEFKSPGLDTLLQAGVEREYWPQDFADKQRFLSDPVIVTPAISQTELTDDDELLVMATDGLWDVMPPSDVLRWAKNKLKTGQNAKEVAEGLIGVALKRKTTDNVSCIVIDFKGAEHWKASGGGSSSWFGGLFGKK